MNNMFKINNILIFLYLLTISSCVSLNNSDEGVSDVLHDPFEETNRTVFDFNNKLDDYFFKPVARGWRELPQFPKNNLANLAKTAGTPVDLANAALQLDGNNFGLILRRFLINITFGLGGMYDVANTPEFGNLKARNEDFGQTLAVHGISDGPYIMLPIFGPSSTRDAFGRVIDTIFNPLSFAYRMNGVSFEGRLTQPIVSGVDKREQYLDYVEEIKDSSLDFYATMRSLYKQRRNKDILNGKSNIENVSFESPSFSYDEDVINIQTNFEESIDTLKIFKDDLPSSNSPDYNEENTQFLTN
jgi:phospholipid-binding lipoprotein MlaA